MTQQKIAEEYNNRQLLISDAIRITIKIVTGAVILGFFIFIAIKY